MRKACAEKASKGMIGLACPVLLLLLENTEWFEAIGEPQVIL